MSEKLNALKKALINADLNSMEQDVKKANTPPEFRARLELGPEGGYFVSLPRSAADIPDAVEMFKDFDLDPNMWEVVSARESRWQRYDG